MAADFFVTTPAEDPLSYPGQVPTHSYVLLGRRKMARVQPRRGRRLGQATVYPDEENGESTTCTKLNYLLLRENAAPVDNRHPVVAVGSNAAPGQLARKFAVEDVSPVLPVVQAKMSGLRVLPSAHLNFAGYIPATPAAAPGTADEENVFVTFLDDQQRERLDETEPNYLRVALTTRQNTVRLMGSDEQLSGCWVYESKHGVLTDARVLRQFGILPTQRDLLAGLLRALPDLHRMGISDVDTFIAAVREKRLDPQWVTRLIQRDLQVAPVGLAEIAETPSAYGEQCSVLVAAQPSEFAVTPSDTLTPGESGCALSGGTIKLLGLRTHAAILANEFTVIAHVRADDKVGAAQVRLDQTLRNALGVEIQERVRIEPATVARRMATKAADRLLGNSRYVVARVQTADLATVEQDACVLAPLALELLGIVSGDRVILEGHTDDHGRVQTAKLRAFPAPNSMMSLREELSGRTLYARFPSTRDALGVYPDLPWAFLDERTRKCLGLGKLGPVRIRVARGQQIGKEVRELSLIIALALISLLVSRLSAWLRIGGLVGVGSLIVTLIVLRLRARLARVTMPTRTS